MRNEALFYGGMVLAAVSLLAGIISLFLYRIRMIRLEVRMDEEYGKQDENTGFLGRKGKRTCRK